MLIGEQYKRGASPFGIFPIKQLDTKYYINSTIFFYISDATTVPRVWIHVASDMYGSKQTSRCYLSWTVHTSSFLPLSSSDWSFLYPCGSLSFWNNNNKNNCRIYAFIVHSSNYLSFSLTLNFSTLILLLCDFLASMICSSNPLRLN